jgi:hypothetical protein
MNQTAELLPNTAIVAFGYDEKRRPRGAWFAQSSDTLESALTEMKCHIWQKVPQTLRDLCSKLPEGRLLSSGKVMMPGIRKEIHEQLAAASVQVNFDELATTLHDRLTSEEKSTLEKGGHSAPNSPWDDLRVGDLVLAPFGPDEGWWEACVVRLEQGVATLKFPDHPKEPAITRHVSILARAHPSLLEPVLPQNTNR